MVKFIKHSQRCPWRIQNDDWAKEPHCEALLHSAWTRDARCKEENCAPLHWLRKLEEIAGDNR